MTDQQFDFEGLLHAWRSSIDDIAQVTAGLDEAGWRAQTPCPGWSVADIVAHVIDAEAIIAGEPRQDHEPDWGALPHVRSDFGRMTEVGVDARRGWAPSALQAELTRVVDLRQRQLVDGPHDLSAEVAAFAASTLPLGRLLTMRTFDTWVHSQDIRDAIALPGGLGSDGAQVCADLMFSALPRIWGKSVAAPVGAVLLVEVTGPGIVRAAEVEVMADGRAAMRPTSADAPGQATVTVRGSWPAVMRAMSGRALEDADGPQVFGDADLRSRLRPALNVAP